MKPDLLKYAIIRVIPDLRRGESVNIGMVVFLPKNIDVHILPTLHKVRVLDPALDPEVIRDYPKAFENLTSGLDAPEQRHQVLQSLGNVRLSELGCFRLSHADDYERQVEEILSALVVPPTKPRRHTSITRLETAMRQDFSQQHLLSTNVDDIDRHKVVPKFPIVQGGKLAVDFALRNGQWHVTETIDFIGSLETLRGAKFQQSAVKAVTLDSAARKLKGGSVPLVVYQAETDDIMEVVQPSINLLSDYAEQLFNYANLDERAVYFARMASLAGQLDTEQPTH